MKKLYALMTCTLLSAGLTFTSCEDMLDQVNPNKQTEDTFGEMKLILKWRLPLVTHH